MLKRGTNKHSKGSLQAALNPLSNRNNQGNESFNAISVPQFYPSTPEYTIELKTNLKPPPKLTTKKTPEVQISIGSPKENIEIPRTHNENSPMMLARKISVNKIKPTSPIRSYCRELKPVKGERNVLKEYNSNDDAELAQRILKVQNDLNKIGVFEPRSPTSAGGHMQNVKYSGFIDVITQLKEVVDKLQLRDASQKQEIATLKRTNEKLKNNLVVLEQKLKTQKDRRDTGFLSPARLESRSILASKRNSRDVVKLTLEEKAHSFAKSVLSSPSHKTFDLSEYKGKILEAEMSTDRHAKYEKINKSNSLSTAKLPPNIINSQAAVSMSNPTLETKMKEFDPKQTTEIDSLVQIKTVTMSDIDNLGGTTLSTHQPVSQTSLSNFEPQSQNIKDSKASSLLDPLLSLSRRDRSIADNKASPERITPNRLPLSHQKSQGSSSAISFPKTSFVPSKVRRDELRIRVNDKGLGSRSLSQSRYERHRDSDFLCGTFSPTASKVMKQYKHYLNEPHISPLQSESKSINMDFGGQYLNNTSKNADDTRNLSVNNVSSPNRKGSTQTFLVDDLSKTVIPEEFRLEDFKKYTQTQTPEEEKVTLFNRCLKLTMGLSTAVIDENQYKKDGEMKILTPPPNLVSSPSIKKSLGVGIAVRK